MVTIEPLVVKAASALGAEIIKRGKKAFTSNKNDYEKELENVINATIEEFKKTHDVSTTGKIHFIISAEIITGLLKFRLYTDFDVNELINGIINDGRIQAPTQTEISDLLDIFSRKLLTSSTLEYLNIENNYKEEIFKIAPKIKQAIQEQISPLVTAVNEIKAQISTTGTDAGVVEEWLRQLDEIVENIEAFKPKTALDRLTKLEERIISKNVTIDDAMEGKLAYIKASCLSETETNDITSAKAPLYIKAATLCPLNVEFQINAGLSYFIINEHEKAKIKADEILHKNEFSVGAWLIKCYISENILSYLSKVPDSVRNDKLFKAPIRNYLMTKRLVSETHEIDSLNLGFDISQVPLPEKITHKNKDFWVLTINYLLTKLYQEHPMMGSIGPAPEILEDKLFAYMFSLLEKIVTAVKGSEVEEKYAWHKFNLMYWQYMKSYDIKQIAEMERVFASIKNKSEIECIMIVQVLNSTKNQEDTKKAIAVINDYGEDKEDIMPLFNSFNYLIVDDIPASIKSFNNYRLLNKPINERSLFNTLEYLKLLNAKNPHEKEDLAQAIAVSAFQSQGLKQLFAMLHPTEELKKLPQEEIRAMLQAIKGEFPAGNESLRYYVIIACYSWGYTDEVLSYLDGNEILTGPCPESVYYCKAMFYGDGDKMKLLDILTDYRNKTHGNFDFYAIELTLRQTLKDYAGIIEACKAALHYFPTNEKIIYTLLHAYDQNTDVESIKEYAPKLVGINFKDEVFIVSVASILVRAQLYDQSLELLYNVALKTRNKAIKQTYFMALANYPQNMFKEYPTVAEGYFVKYEYERKVYILHVEKDAMDSSPVNAMIGKAVGDTFAVQTPPSKKLYSGKILRIVDKYIALLEEIILESENPMAGYSMKQITLEKEFSLDDFHKKLIEEFGADETEIKNTKDDFLNQYYAGTLTFCELTNAVFKKNSIEAYYYLTSYGKTFRAVPTSISVPNITDQTKFVLDITSVCYFFDLNRSLGLTFADQFIVSKFVKLQVEKLIKETKAMPPEGLSVNISTESVTGHTYDKTYVDNRLNFLTDLLGWVNDNCLVDMVGETLNFIKDQTSDLAGDDYILYYADNRLMADRPDHVLLTNDVAYYRMFSGNTDNIISPEIYVEEKLSASGTQVTELCIQKNYVGINITKTILQEEFMKMLAGKDNRFVNCLDNLNLSWNPNNEHIKQAILFLKWLYLSEFIRYDLKGRTALNVFVSLLTRSSVEQRLLINQTVKNDFSLMGKAFMEIQYVLLDALKMVNSK